jgi:hypothetical protein
LAKFDAWQLKRQRPYIQYLDFPKTCDMGDKPVEAGTDVQVPPRLGGEYTLCDDEILNKIFTARRAGFLSSVMQAGFEL